jgi:hypothetical protein
MSSQDELQQEYQFDYLKGKPNRFASVAPESPVVVTLDDDVSCVFTTPEAVNRALRALIAVVPTPAAVSQKTRKSAGRRSGWPHITMPWALRSDHPVPPLITPMGLMR